MNAKRVAVALLALLQAGTTPVYAQAPDRPVNSQVMPQGTTGGVAAGDISLRLNQIDGMVNQRMAALGIPAYCLVVIKNGQVVFQKPYGFADVDKQIPATNDTVFGLASLTKTFTALTLLSLVDRGLIGLEDPLSKYLEGLTPPYQSLTIRQLASMTAGVPKQLSQEVLWQDQMPILMNTPLASQPGSQFLYSNFSYRLLGSVIAKVTGRPYFEVVRETIFGPLGMNSSATTVLLQPTGRVAQGYGDNGGQGPLRPIAYKNPAVSTAAGMLASTTDDLTKYVFGLMSGKLLSPAGYETLWKSRPPLSTGAPSKWAFGWSAGRNPNFGGEFSVQMNGGTQGVASTIIILPETQSAVIALCNLRKPPVYEIAKVAARMAFGNASQVENIDEAPQDVGD